MSILHYQTPAKNVNEGLPLGNGRLGCTVFGGVPNERLVLNEETLWSGKKRNRINPECRKHLGEIRGLLADGKIAEAERLASLYIASNPPTERRYTTMCDITLNMLHGADIGEYRRSLDLESAKAQTSYVCENVRYKREIFVSRPADCIVIKLTAEGGKLSFVAGGKVKGGFEKVRTAKDGSAVFFGGEGIKYACVMKVVNCDGEVLASGAEIYVKNATYALLLVTAATDMHTRAPYKRAAAILQKAKKLDYNILIKEHIADYKSLFCKATLNFGKDERADIPTDIRLKEFAGGKEDNGLISTYFDYGKYLLISSSRKGGLPANLQGIWADEHFPCWDSKYTININLEMNYWHADACGLDDCYEPYFSLLRKVRKNGRKTAKKMYGCRGFVAHHNTDITADTAPQDKVASATYWTLGGAWLALHIAEHYDFSGDENFLRKNYPVLRDAVKFFNDFLIEDEQGFLVTSPSISPENSYIDAEGEKVSLCRSPASDIAILTRLYKDFIFAAQKFGKDKSLLKKAEDVLEKIPPYRIGDDGRLLEWGKEYEEPEPGHRHLSHLIGLFPCCDITEESIPKLYAAAKKSLEYRLSHGGGYTGWSRAWVFCLKARLKEGEEAYENLRYLIANSTLPNLTDSHPRPTGDIFQIDGNFGATRGICEMLLQSYENTVYILPALPKALPQGEAKDLRARGGLVCSIKWNGGKAEKIELSATRDIEFNVVYGDKKTALSLKKGERACLDKYLNLLL